MAMPWVVNGSSSSSSSTAVGSCLFGLQAEFSRRQVTRVDSYMLYYVSVCTPSPPRLSTPMWKKYKEEDNPLVLLRLEM